MESDMEEQTMVEYQHFRHWQILVTQIIFKKMEELEKNSEFAKGK